MIATKKQREKIKNCLTRSKKAGWFQIFYAYPEDDSLAELYEDFPRSNRLHGVERKAVIQYYRRALLVLVEKLKQMAPTISQKCDDYVEKGNHIKVYVLDLRQITLEGFAYTEMPAPPGVAFSTIYLPARFPQQTNQVDLLKFAEVVAVHEGVHAFLDWCRRCAGVSLSPKTREGISLWLWMEEAIALYFESLLFPRTEVNVHYSQVWHERPYLSLDEIAYPYRNLLFVHYLYVLLSVPSGAGSHPFARHLPEGMRCVVGNPKPDHLLIRMWSEVQSKERPLQTLRRLWRDDDITPNFIAMGTDEWDFFSWFCHDAFYVNEFPRFYNETGLTLEQRLSKRFGSRTVSTRAVFGAPSSNIQDTITHLSCHYYQFDLSNDLWAYSSPVKLCLRIVLDPEQFTAQDSKPEHSPLKAYVAFVGSRGTRKVPPHPQLLRCLPGDPLTLSQDLEILPESLPSRTLLLTVVNILPGAGNCLAKEKICSELQAGVRYIVTHTVITNATE